MLRCVEPPALSIDRILDEEDGHARMDGASQVIFTAEATVYTHGRGRAHERDSACGRQRVEDLVDSVAELLRSAYACGRRPVDARVPARPAAAIRILC
jgi:hypothetical protein